MSHEITATDGLVLHREAAWHGLGTIVDDAPTPGEALRMAGLDWRVEQLPMMAFGAEGERVAVDSHVLNVRSDNHESLGVVGTGYEPIQNEALADFAEALAEQGDVVRVESAGSIRGGRKVWFLLRGESFSVRGRDGDVLEPYILVSNGHDGTAAMRCTPTTVRVVCSNTLHMVLPKNDRGQLADAAYVVRHMGDIRGKVREAQAALKLYGRAMDATQDLAGTLAAADVSRAALQSFWLHVYQRLQAPVPADPKTPGQRTQRNRAEEAIGAMAERFDAERDVAGANGWAALNAFTGWLQHDGLVRGQDAEEKADSRVRSRLFGTTAKKTQDAARLALAAFG